MAVIKTNTFEGGTNTTAITTGNSGGSSGDAWNSLGGSPTYDNTNVAHGSMAGKVPAGGTAPFFGWTAIGTKSQVWFRQYIYQTAYLSAGGNDTIALAETSTGAVCGSVKVNGTGKLLTFNGAGTLLNTSTNSIPLNALCRVEGFVKGSATVGQIEVKLFNSPESTTATETFTSASNINTTGLIDKWFPVSIGASAGTIFWIDEIVIDDAAYPGPFAVNGSATGAVATITTSAPSGTATVPVTVQGDVATMATAAPAGKAELQKFATGTVATMVTAAPAGTAKAVAQNITGQPATMAVAAPAGTVHSSPTVTGTVATMTVTSFPGSPSAFIPVYLAPWYSNLVSPLSSDFEGPNVP